MLKLARKSANLAILCDIQKNKNEKGFALVLSLVLLMAMSLMGGALIVISASDHQSNNVSDEFQQTFYVAETALLEGEKYIINQLKNFFIYEQGNNSPIYSTSFSSQNVPYGGITQTFSVPFDTLKGKSIVFTGGKDKDLVKPCVI